MKLSTHVLDRKFPGNLCCNHGVEKYETIKFTSSGELPAVAFKRLPTTSILTARKWNAPFAELAVEAELAATFVRSLKEAFMGN